MGRLQTARLENFIRRWGSIKGGGSVLSESLGDVFPILDLENLTPENHAPAGWYPFFLFATASAVAAQTAGVSLINPVNSGSLVVVDGFVATLQIAGSMTVGTSLPLFTQIANVSARDTRLSAFSGVPRFGTNINVAAIENGLLLRLGASVDRTIELPNGVAVLAPGTQLALVASTVNSDVTGSFYGRARLAEPSELSF